MGNTLKTAITTRAPVVLITDVTSPCLSYRLCTYVATILPFKSVKSPKTDLFPHCLLLPLFAQFKTTHLSKIPIATHRSKIGSYLSSSGNSPIRAWCIQLKRMQQHESHSLGEKQNEFKICLNLNVEYVFPKGRGEAIQEFSNLIILRKQKTWNSGETD